MTVLLEYFEYKCMFYKSISTELYIYMHGASVIQTIHLTEQF